MKQMKRRKNRVLEYIHMYIYMFLEKILISNFIPQFWNKEPLTKIEC